MRGICCWGLQGKFFDTGSSKYTGDDGPRGKLVPGLRRYSWMARPAWILIMQTVSVRVLRRLDRKCGVQYLAYLAPDEHLEMMG